jgi:DNA-binding transcriptional MerR regulator
MSEEIIGLTASEVGRLLGKTGQTIKNWTETFSEFLSPLATQKNKTRIFNSEDLRVLKLVKQMLDLGARTEEIALTLRNGDRAEIEDLQEISMSLQMNDLEAQRLELELNITRREIAKRDEEIRVLREIAAQSKQTAEENIRLQERLQVMQEEIQNIRQGYSQQLGQVAGIYLQTLRQREDELRDLHQQIADQREQMGKSSALADQLTRTQHNYRSYYQSAQQRIRELEAALNGANSQIQALQDRLMKLMEK